VVDTEITEAESWAKATAALVDIEITRQGNI
jgi:hypothetical protein